MADDVAAKLMAATTSTTARTYSLPILVMEVPYITSKGKGRVKVAIDGQDLTVEQAVTHTLESSGYVVFRGDDIHIAGHVLTGKFMGWRDDPTTFINWGVSHGSDADQLRGGNEQLCARRTRWAPDHGRRPVAWCSRTPPGTHPAEARGPPTTRQDRPPYSAATHEVP